jgi:hypothetical protein
VTYDRVDDKIAEFTPGAAITITARPAIRSTAGGQRHVKGSSMTVYGTAYRTAQA